MTELPTLQEEIDRKAIETLEMLLNRHARGYITTAQLEVGLDALFGAVSGLARKDFLELITAASGQLASDASYRTSRLLWNTNGKGALVLFEPLSARTSVFLFQRLGDAKVFELDSSRDAATKAEQLITTLQHKGYEESL